MNDSWIKDRVKGLYKETSPDEEEVTEPDEDRMTSPARVESQVRSDAPAGADVERALQALALAQRTAEEHLARAQREADRIQAEARSRAEQIVRDAQGLAQAVRREADKSLSEARASAARIAEGAQAHADDARRGGQRIVSDARVRAAETAKDAEAYADRLAGQARLRYEEMVGTLAAQREALQQQIEALQEFDRDHRARLLTFVQAHLRALWVDEPHITAEIEPGSAASSRRAREHQPDPRQLGTPRR